MAVVCGHERLVWGDPWISVEAIQASSFFFSLLGGGEHIYSNEVKERNAVSKKC